VLTFILLLVDYDVKDNKYRNALVSAIVILGIDSETAWTLAINYTSTILAIITVVKMFVLYQAKRSREKEIRHLCDDSGYTELVVEEVAPSHFNLVKEATNSFITLISFGGRPTPMD
jgi:hypothetical protein